MQAWLSLSPDDKSPTNAEVYPTLDAPQVDEGYEYLVDFLHEIGTVGTGGMSVTPLTFTEIKSWSDLTDTPLDSFETKALMAMSRAYSNQVSDKEAECPIDSDEVRERINQANIAAWLAFAKNG